MELTDPITPEDIRAAYPREARGMGDAELQALIPVAEAAIRGQFGVTRTDAAAQEPLRLAMLAAWPSFVQQVRQVATETHGADSHSVTYNRAGVIDFTFPAFVGAILAGVVDPEAIPSGPATTELVR